MTLGRHTLASGNGAPKGRSMTLGRIIAETRESSELERVGAELRRINGPELRLYPIERCERCGCDCEGPNASGWLGGFDASASRELAQPRRARVALVSLGVELVESSRLPELGWSEAFGGATCDACDIAAGRALEGGG